MRSAIVAAAAALLFIAPVQALAGGEDAPGQRDDNWGEVTSDAITENDWDQGKHARDPSGDGVGPGNQEGKRSGLANVDERGSLSSTMDLLGF